METNYSKLPDSEKRKLRIERAEIMALEDIANGFDINYILKRCVERELYCGAEGIKRAIEKSKK